MDMRKLVGRNFGRFRKANGLSFAEASGFTQQYISDLERGRRNPTVVTLSELASTLGISHVDLVVPDDEARSERTRIGTCLTRSSRKPEVRTKRKPRPRSSGGAGRSETYSPFFRGRDHSSV
jgi:transcriptional regulator with XRE-family HTH domain